VLVLAPGSPAPPLSGPTDQGAFDLGAHRGQPVVVYFYPKDMTPGCTTEARDFRDLSPQFQALGAVVVGVSRDPVERHARFREKECLPFPLVADDAGTIVEAWGVWAEKKLYGRAFMGIVRTTFLVDAQGRIARVWSKVRVKGHAAEVLAATRVLTG
jgi:thioredoxin-dependent peroxiredoxin